MEWLTADLGGGAVAMLGRRLWDRRAVRRDDAVELEQMKRVADEDVTLLGEELARLDGEVRGRDLDAETRLTDVDRISTVTDTLATGRYAIGCVRARLAGQPVPERRVPCFFNPQHGPSVIDVVWTSRPVRRTLPR